MGIVESKKLVAERTFPLDQRVTVGSGPKDTFVVASLTGSTTLFERASQGVVLAREVRPRTRVRGGDAEATLALGDRGKIDLGHVKVLYQVVHAPPALAAPPVGAMDFRPRFVEDDDPVFLQSLAMWSALGLLLGVYVATAPQPQNIGIVDVDAYFVKLPAPVVVVDEPEATPEPEPEPDLVAVVERVEERRHEEHVEPPPEARPERSDTQRAADIAAARDRLEERMSKSGILSTTGDTSWGIDADDAVAMDSLQETRSWHAEEGGTREGTDIDGPADLDLPGRIGIDDGVPEIGGWGNVVVTPEEPTLTEDVDETDRAVLKKTLRRYRPQVRYCYENELKKNPRLAGRIEFGVVLDEGRVVDVWTEEQTMNSPGMERCVHNRIRRWEFPRSASGELFWPFVFSQAE